MLVSHLSRRSATTRIARLSVRVGVLLFCFVSIGCASLANPVANGIPVRLVPPELLGEPKSNFEAMPLSMLRQPPPEAYVLDADDVLGVWIEGVLGEKGQPPQIQYSEARKAAPALGYPIVVRADGTIHLPYIDPIKVQGLTLTQAEAAIRKAYTVDRQIIQPGRERISVTLAQPRQYHVLVIRQDGGNETGAATAASQNRVTGFLVGIGSGETPGASRGRGFAIDLPAYENDVLNALAKTGGFPGPDAVNEIVVERSLPKGNALRPIVVDEKAPACGLSVSTTTNGTQVFRIPLRYRKGQRPNIPPEVITLQSGDTVYIESRQLDVFYTAGLLPPGQFILPRDVDLDVVEAITRVGGSINSGGVSAQNISGTALTNTGTSSLGGPSPSLVTVLRRTPNGGQVTIRVDLNRALRDPRERILVQPKDVVMLQQTPLEAASRYASTVFRLNYVYQLVNSSRANVDTSAVLP